MGDGSYLYDLHIWNPGQAEATVIDLDLRTLEAHTEAYDLEAFTKAHALADAIAAAEGYPVKWHDRRL